MADDRTISPSDQTLADSPPATVALPAKVGPYRIISILGRGGMGVVYRAEQANPRREVALKVIGLSFVTPERLKRFALEAQTLGRLKHPGIAQVYEAGLADTPHGPQPFFAMELVEGGVPLDQYATQNKLNLRQRLELLARVCDAVQYAHQQSVIHRDLKPDNILVTSDGQPKILDFGVARVTDADVQTTTIHTDVGQVIGTLPYMSPEQAGGNPDEVDTRSDVYALGVIAYELLAGRLPYDLSKRALVEAVRIIREDEPTKLSNISRTLRGDVETIVGKALAKEKNRRYASVNALAADIRRYLGDEPIAARPPSAWYQVRKFAKRNRAVVVGIAAVFVVLIAGIVGTTTMYIRAQRQRAEAVRQKELAQARFNDVRQLANTFLFDVHDKIQDLAGSTPARKLLVQTALEYLSKLSSQAVDDNTLRREITAAYLRIGDVQGNPNYASLGDTKGAMDSYRKSLNIAEELAAADPTNMTAQRALSLSGAKIGDVLAATGDARGALDTYRKSLEIDQKRADADPNNATALRDLSIGHERIGTTLAAMGDKNAALESYRAFLKLSRKLADAHPTDATSQRDLLLALEKIGDILAASGDVTGALKGYRESLAIYQKLASADPTNSNAQRDVSVSHEKIGDILAAAGDTKSALECYRKSLEIDQKLADADPANATAQHDLAMSDSKIGSLLLDAGDAAGALEIYRRSLRIRQRIVDGDPTNANAARDLSISHDGIGDVLVDLGDMKAAMESFRVALGVRQRLADAHPTDATAQHDLMASFSKMSDLLSRLASGGTTETHSRLDLWRQARAWHVRVAEQFELMKTRNMLSADDMKLADEVAAGPSRCDAAIAELTRAATQPASTAPARQP